MSEAPDRAGNLQRALQADAPELGVERILSIERLTSGLSSQSYRVEAETSDGPATWVMRVEPEFGVIPPYDITREYRLLKDVGQSDLPVPRMLYLGEDPRVVGGRFLLMSFIEGVIYRSKDLNVLTCKIRRVL